MGGVGRRRSVTIRVEDVTVMLEATPMEMQRSGGFALWTRTGS